MKKELIIGITIVLIVIAVGAFFMNNQIEDNFNEPCDNSKKPFEYNAKPPNTDLPPDTYLVKVYVETTSLWTNVEVEGLHSITAGEYTPLSDIDPEINIDVKGLEVKDISIPRTKFGDTPQNSPRV